jgi:dTDP-4-dehydrorhamnose reductase
VRVLITGGKGQLGVALQNALDGEEISAPGHDELDITDRASVSTAVSDFRPDVVIHAAAWTDTAGCEADPERAIAVNAAGAGNVAEACSASGAAMVYVSSNEVFDGDSSEPYLEDAATSPLNSYGLSKLAGERAVSMALDAHCIVRTSWLYGPGRISFPEKVLNAAAKGELRMVTDEVASPTYTVDLASAVAKLIRLEPRGVFHITNTGGCSRLEWAQAILEIAGIEGVPVRAVTQSEFAAPYRKPTFSVLANSRAAALGIAMRPWRDALIEHLGGGETVQHGAGAISSLQ